MTTPFRNCLAAFGLAGAIALAAVPAVARAAEAPLPISTLPQGPLLGERVQPGNVSRTIVVTPGQSNIGVEAGESVAFRFGTEQAAWAFAPRSGAGALELARMFPEIPAAQGVWVQIRPNSMFSGG